MSKHTERLWAVSKDATPDYAPQYTIYADYPDGRWGERVATVHGPEALAELIAAAPEMLDLLAKLADYDCDGYGQMARALLSRLEDV